MNKEKTHQLKQIGSGSTNMQESHSILAIALNTNRVLEGNIKKVLF
jgi:hypothetical protein